MLIFKVNLKKYIHIHQYQIFFFFFSETIVQIFMISIGL